MNDWRALGACRDKPVHWFFPPVTRTTDNHGDPADVADALNCCASCPVLLDCRTWGIAHEKEGVWGGLTASQRDRQRRRTGIRLYTLDTDDDSWKRPRAAYLFRQGWTAGQIATELRAEVRSVHRWLNAEGLDAYPPPD